MMIIISLFLPRRLDLYAGIGVELDAARGPSVVDTEEVQRKARASIKAMHPDKAGATTGLVHIYVIQINNEDITSEGRSRNHNL